MIRILLRALGRSLSFPSLALLAIYTLAPMSWVARDASAQTTARELPQGLEPGIRMPGYVPGEAIVQLQKPVTREEAEAIARSEGGELAEMLSPEGLIKVRWKDAARGVFQ